MQSNLTWNLKLKLSNNIYPTFDMKFEALFMILLGQAMYGFKAQKINNLVLQTIYKSKLK